MGLLKKGTKILISWLLLVSVVRLLVQLAVQFAALLADQFACPRSSEYSWSVGVHIMGNATRLSGLLGTTARPGLTASKSN